jgi:hypothetical protein
MKRVGLNQVRSWRAILLAGWLLAGLAPIVQAGLFTGDLGTNNWTQIPVSDNDGGFVFTGTGDTIALVLTSSAISGFSDTLITLEPPYLSAPELVDFNWTLTANGNVGGPQAYFYVDTLQYPLQGDSGRLTDIEIPANTPIYFELVGNVTPGKSPAQLEITVPEPGNALGGMLMLAGGFEWFRRKRKAGG